METYSFDAGHVVAEIPGMPQLLALASQADAAQLLGILGRARPCLIDKPSGDVVVHRTPQPVQLTLHSTRLLSREQHAWEQAISRAREAGRVLEDPSDDEKLRDAMLAASVDEEDAQEVEDKWLRAVSLTNWLGRPQWQLVDVRKLHAATTEGTRYRDLVAREAEPKAAKSAPAAGGVFTAAYAASPRAELCALCRAYAYDWSELRSLAPSAGRRAAPQRSPAQPGQGADPGPSGPSA